MRRSSLIFILITCFFSNSIFSANISSHSNLDQKALAILHHMSLKEKIGQKIMLDFRYWCTSKPKDNQPCTNDFSVMNPTIKNLMSQYHIGGIILFSNNLKTIAQITTLTDAFTQTMIETHNIPLLVGTDQEGGIVARLPRDQSVTFPGNMAIAAAYLGHQQDIYSSKIGKVIADDLKAVGINVDFAPDVDVNVNPLNPVINVRSFSDDPELVATLGLHMTEAIQAQGVGATLKHFPGHGDTTVDSHVGLPIVNHSLDEAFNIDLYPFKNIIKKDAPDLIMTAHIQFPALDSSTVYATKIGENIITPATLSRKIQYDLLRTQLGYQGVVITDALDMGAIALNFDPIETTIKAFEAGDDIALMPVAIYEPEDSEKLSQLISSIEAAVLDGRVSEKELNESVLRILKLKIKLGLFNQDTTSLPEKISRAEELFRDKSQRDLENNVTDDAITLVQNNNGILPIKLSAHARIHILTPWLEQGAGIAIEIMRLQQAGRLPLDITINFIKLADTNFENEKIAVDSADVIIVGNSTTKSSPLTANRVGEPAFPFQKTLVFPDMLGGDKKDYISANLLMTRNLSDAQLAYQVLQYAHLSGKKTIFLSLLAPYDLPNYKDVSDAMLVGYDFYGYLANGESGYYRGPSMQALTRVIFGISKAQAKLPINIPNPTNVNENVYKRGDGLITE